MSNLVATHRKEIDGLRAIAVLPVILFHAGITQFSGGFVGVDVFFVISGYLITTIILRELYEGRFSIVNFYERRARRILPALFLVVLVCIPLAFAWLLPAELWQFGRSLVAVAGFSSNFLFWKESGYFAGAADEKPLLHTWSLAVEEQFYVIFPIFVMLLWRFGLRAILASFLTVIVLSLGLAEWASKAHPNPNFYLLPTRAWELIFGALAAVGLYRRELPSGLPHQVLATMGLGLIFGSVWAFSASTPFPSLWGLLPVGGTLLVIVFASHKTVVGRLLACRPLVGLGLVSYSAYLWHQPMFAFARARSVLEPGATTMLLLSALAIVLAVFSWRFVEQPFRDRSRISRSSVFGFAAIGSVFIALLGCGLIYTKGLPGRLPVPVLELVKAAAIPRDGAVCKQDQLQPAGRRCRYHAELPVSVALWGDSHAMAFGNQLGSLMAENGRGMVRLAKSACPPILNVTRPRGQSCVKHNLASIKNIVEDDQIDTVVLGARWALTLEGTRFNNQEGGQESGSRVVNLSTQTGLRLSRSQLSQSIRSTIERLLAAGKDVVIVGNIPEVGLHVPKSLAKAEFFGLKSHRPLSTSEVVFQRRNASTKHVFSSLNALNNVVYVDPSGLFCGAEISGRCLAEREGVPLYFDDDHVAPVAAWEIAKIVVNAVVEFDKKQSIGGN